jgi:succinate--hydroxymethylglutarate CoA-transferase
MVDMATGLYLHGAILAAVYARDRHGTGQRVDTSLFEAQLSLLTNVGLSWLNLGIEAQRWGCQHPSIAPYDAFQTKDAYLVCGATNDAQFVALCKLLGLEDLITDERFATNPKRVENRHLLGPVFNQVFLTRTTKEWASVFDKTGLPFGPINNIERAFEHPQTVARDMISHVRLDAAESGEIRLIGPAVKFSRTRTSLQRAPPRLGEHTSDLLEELGIEKQEAANLKKKGVI